MNKQSPFSFVVVTMIKIALVVGVIYVVYHATVTAYDFGYRIFNEPPVSSIEATTTVVIKEEYSVSDIGDILVEEGLIQDANIFFFQEWFAKEHGKIVPGSYELSPSMTGEEMVTIMSLGEITVEE